jgi:hypothetical protein
VTKLTVKCSDEEIAAWREAAWDQRLSLSAWVRTRLNGGALAAGVGADDRGTPRKDDVVAPAASASDSVKTHGGPDWKKGK